MGIELMADRTYTVCYSKRHVVTRQSVGLRRTKIKTSAEAERVFDQLVKKVNEKIHKTLSPPWSKVVKEFSDDQLCRGLNASTVHSSQTTLDKHTVRLWGNRPIDTITRREIRDIVFEKLSTNAEAHKKYVLKCIRGVFQYAVEMDYIKHNPTPIIKFKTRDKIMPVLTEQQATFFLNKAREFDSPFYEIWSTAIYTGMRSGELYALRWKNVDLDNRTIKVCESWSNKDGFKDFTKNGKDRLIEISPALLPIFKELKLKNSYGDFVLPRHEKWDRGELARELRGFLRLIGLPEMRVHDLRATFATIMLSKGVEPVKVMKLGGWADMDTMMIYVRKAGIDIRGSTDKLILHEHNQTTGQVISMRL